MRERGREGVVTAVRVCKGGVGAQQGAGLAEEGRTTPLGLCPQAISGAVRSACGGARMPCVVRPTPCYTPAGTTQNSSSDYRTHPPVVVVVAPCPVVKEEHKLWSRGARRAKDRARNQRGGAATCGGAPHMRRRRHWLGCHCHWLGLAATATAHGPRPAAGSGPRACILPCCTHNTIPARPAAAGTVL